MWWQNKISCDSISIACHQLPKQSMQSQLEKKFKVFELKVCPAGVLPYYPLGVFDIAKCSTTSMRPLNFLSTCITSFRAPARN